MPTKTYSAMNPNGSFQADPFDQIELANRQYGLQQQQVGNAQSHDALMAQLALRQLQSGDNHFDADLKDRQAARGEHRQDNLNQFAAMADLTKAGWTHDDTRHSGDLAAQLAIAKLGKEPNALDQARYSDEKGMRDTLMSYLGIGGQAAPAAQPAPSGIDLGNGMTLPGFQHASLLTQSAPASPHTGVGSIDPQKLQTVAALNALMHGGSMPDLGRQDAEHTLLGLKVDEAKNTSAANRVAALIQAGQGDEARKVAAAAGVPMPDVNPESLIADPAISGAIDEATRSGNDMAGKSYFFGVGGDAEGVKKTLAKAVQILVGRGVKPETAKAYVIQKLRSIAGTEGSHGLRLNGFYDKGKDALADVLDQGSF